MAPDETSAENADADAGAGASEGTSEGEGPSASEGASAGTSQSEGASAGTGEGDSEGAGEGEGVSESASEGEGVSAGRDQDGQKRKRKRKRKRAAGPEGRPRPKPATDRVPFQVGEEVYGKVTAVLDPAIMIDLSGKALGIFDRTEMESDDLVPGVGDRFVARVLIDGARGGLVVLTRKPLREETAKPWLEQAAKDGSICPGLVTGVVRGGVEVMFGGLRAFAPASGMDLHPAEANFAALLGERMDFKVAEYSGQGRDVVVTRRPMLEAEARERRKKAKELLQEGQVMRGVVRTVVDWGAFVALREAENLEGLVHVSEASHDPRAKMLDLFKPGDEVDVKIKKIDDKGKIALSVKALIEDPWAEAKQKYAPRSIHKGKVTRVEKFGAFVQLEDGIEGLLHVSDLSLKHVESAADLVKADTEMDVLVYSFDPVSKRVVLHPAPPPDQANEAAQDVKKGVTIKAKVVRAESAGLIVRILGATGRQARAFVPAGHTGTPRGTELRSKFRVGFEIEAKVIEIDPRRGEPKLSIRVLAEDEERDATREYKKKLKAEASFGTLGDLFAKKS